MSDTKYFTIRASPSSVHSVAHSVGIFSSREKAESFIPSGGRSTDIDNGATWSYYVIEKTFAHPVDPSELDKVPDYFPYTGW